MAGKGQSQSIEAKSDRLADMLDAGQGKQVINQLRQEFDAMSPREYSRLVRDIARKDDKLAGANLIVVMSGRAELVLVDDGKGRANRTTTRASDVPVPAAAPFRPAPAVPGPPHSLAEMRQRAIERDPCALYQDLHLRQLSNISQQYRARPRLDGDKRALPAYSPVVIDVAAQKRLQEVAAQCKASQKRHP